MCGSRQTVLSEDYSLLGMRIVGSKVMLGLYSTRLGEAHGQGPLGCDRVGETR